jgi:hypothetical protein
VVVSVHVDDTTLIEARRDAKIDWLAVGDANLHIYGEEAAERLLHEVALLHTRILDRQRVAALGEPT